MQLLVATVAALVAMAAAPVTNGRSPGGGGRQPQHPVDELHRSKKMPVEAFAVVDCNKFITPSSICDRRLKLLRSPVPANSHAGSSICLSPWSLEHRGMPFQHGHSPLVVALITAGCSFPNAWLQLSAISRRWMQLRRQVVAASPVGGCSSDARRLQQVRAQSASGHLACSIGHGITRRLPPSFAART